MWGVKGDEGTEGRGVVGWLWPEVEGAYAALSFFASISTASNHCMGQ